MAERLAGQRIVVTGGGRGIGAEMAKAMAAEGGVATFLVSKDSEFMTGQTLLVDGGIVLG